VLLPPLDQVQAAQQQACCLVQQEHHLQEGRVEAQGAQEEAQGALDHPFLLKATRAA
jgi:hypothetical protein